VRAASIVDCPVPTHGSKKKRPVVEKEGQVSTVSLLAYIPPLGFVVS
jgi:hypothetical protein